MKGALMHLHSRRECFLLYQLQTCGAGLQYGGVDALYQNSGRGSMSSQKMFASTSSNSRFFGAEGHAKGAGKNLKI